MVNTVTFGQLLAQRFQSDSIIPFENTGGETKRDVFANVSVGSTVKLISSMADFPPEVNGFITLEQTISYTIIEPFTITSPILFPAGWIGFIRSSFLNELDIFYSAGGGTPLFNTLNIDGVISSIADAGSGFITVTTSVAHGILDGQYVNIETTSHNVQRLAVSNVTVTTFDVEVTFVANEAGLFNTGYEFIEIKDAGIINGADADLFNVTGANLTSSALSTNGVLLAGYLSLGTIRNCANVAFVNSGLAFITGGITLEDIDTTRMVPSQIVSLGANPLAIAVTITGSLTRRVIVDNFTIFLDESTQRPFKIDTNIINADVISIQNSPDNEVATEYFDASGLDQTDPQVLTKNNGDRADSMVSAQVGFTNIATPIVVPIVTQDVPVLIGGTDFIANNLERATADTAGQITNLSKRTKKYSITFSGLIEKAGGGTTDIGILIVKNGSLVLTNTFQIPHSVNSGIIQISATRTFKLADGDTIELAVVNFDGTADVNVSQANIAYSVDS